MLAIQEAIHIFTMHLEALGMGYFIEKLLSKPGSFGAAGNPIALPAILHFLARLEFFTSAQSPKWAWRLAGRSPPLLTSIPLSGFAQAAQPC